MALMDASNTAHPLSSICKLWLQKINLSKKQRWERFGQYAVEAMKFFDAASSNWMWTEEVSQGPNGYLSKGGGAHLPTFRMTVNKLAEVVALYGPSLYYQNPNVTVSLNESPEYTPESLGFDARDEQGMQQFGQLMDQHQLDRSLKKTYADIFQAYANRVQHKTDKKTHSRRAIVEAILAGASYLYTEIYQPRGGGIRYPRSRYLSWQDVGFDMDADYEEDIQWIWIECVHPVNLVEREYGLPEGSLKGDVSSLESQADEDINVRDKNKKKKDGRSFDLLRYYKVYSKNGFGDKLKSKQYKTDLDFTSFGDYCYLVLAKGVPYPLNIPTSALSEPLEAIQQRAAWPIPFWQDEVVSNGWPISKLCFSEKPKSIYPVSMVKPVIGQLRFLNWIMSFLADKTAAACTTYVARAKAAGVEIQNQLLGGMSPYTVIEIGEMLGKSVNDVVAFIQAPSFSIDIWNMASQVAGQIDKALGTIDLLYGQTEHQMRSAREADVKQSNLNIRPEDMATRVEEWVGTSCLKEIEAARWVLGGQDIATVLDPLAGQIWDQQILTMDVDAVVKDFTFRVETGSARKPNKQSRVTQLREIGQVVLPMLQQYASQGVTGPWNAYVKELGKAMDFDAAQFFVEPPPPPPPPPPPEEQPPQEQPPTPEERQHMLAQQAAEQKAMIDQEKLKLAQSKAAVNLQANAARINMEQAKAGQQLQQQAELFDLKRRLMEAKANMK